MKRNEKYYLITRRGSQGHCNRNLIENVKYEDADQ